MSDSREYIIDEAYKLFLSRSYEAVSISDISKAIGYTKGALYYHFKNKEDLFKAVIDKYIVINGMGIASDSMTLSQFIQETIIKAKEAIDDLFKETPLFVPTNVFALFIDAFRHYPDFAIQKNDFFNSEGEKIKFVLDNAVKNGEIRSDINTSVMAMNIFSIILGLAGNLFSNISTSSAIDIMQLQLTELYKILKL